MLLKQLAEMVWKTILTLQSFKWKLFKENLFSGKKFTKRQCFPIKEETEDQIKYLKSEIFVDSFAECNKAYIPYETVSFQITPVLF